MDGDEREPVEGQTPSERPADSEDADATPPVEDEVDEASDQSFPASDPPSY